MAEISSSRIVITVLGKNRPGIVAGVTRVLGEANVDIRDITQSIIEDIFTMTMLADTAESKLDFAELQEALAEAGELIAAAHANGLLVVLWIYPRGKAVTAEKDPDLIAGAAGVALCLGADFVKVNPPKPEGDDKRTAAEALKVASMAAGRTGLVCAGGSTVDAETFLTQLHDQIHVGGADGNATGRNIHQRSLDEAVRLTKAISAITLADYTVADALKVFNGEADFAWED